MIKDIAHEFGRYKSIGQKAMDQVPDNALNQVLSEESNSIAIVIRHISGNLVSRFTAFLSTDGEKSARNRDSEFNSVAYSRQNLQQMWEKGWQTLENTLSKLNDDDLDKTVYIRGLPLTVRQALLRSLAHISYHVGQIVTLARIHAAGNWKWISIPKNKSQEYNRNPTMEK